MSAHSSADSLAAALKDARERAGLTQRQLAELMVVSRATIAEGELGADPRGSTLKRYLEHLAALSPERLLGNPASAPPRSSPAVWTCLRDLSGFVVNRLLVPYMVQALLMLDRGDASKEDIDTAMQFGCGHPMGPITLTDYVGLDTTLFILEGWVSRYPDEPAFAIPNILKEKVAAGKLGRKTGEGFYTWDGDKKA